MIKAFNLICAIVITAVLATFAISQSTTFSYQGSLDMTGIPANGLYDFEFALFGAVSGGNPIGSVVSRPNVNVVDGSFSVDLDFGASFPGPNRFLEIRVRTAGGGGYTTLGPRQMISTVPYAMRATEAANATQLGGVNAATYVTDSSNAFVRNGTSGQTGNFNINGTGTAGTLNAISQYNINGVRVLSTPGSTSNLAVGRGAGLSVTGVSNTFVGSDAGTVVTTGYRNSFFGKEAGTNTTVGFQNTFAGEQAGFSNVNGINNVFVGSAAGLFNTSGAENVFVGWDSGRNTTTGIRNTFIGSRTGIANNVGNENVFIGTDAGDANTGGDYNTFVGRSAGTSSTTANDNSFFGRSSGLSTTSGGANTFVGRNAGSTNITGTHNTMLGEDANVIGTSRSYATAIGSGSRVSSSNTIVLGRAAGEDRVLMPGKLTLGSSATNYSDLNINVPNTNADLYMSGNGSTKGINFGVDSNTTADAKLFISQYDGTIYKDRLWINEFGVVSIGTLGLAGSTSVCRNASLQFATCSSSLRYKDNVENFSSGLNLIKRLRPVSFNWKDGGMLDLGLVAEEVAEVEPLLTTSNSNGQVEGVKYDRVGVVLINVVKEQQEEIERQNERIDKLESELASMKALVCSTNLEAAICVSPRK